MAVWAGLRLILGAAGSLLTVPFMGAVSASAAGGANAANPMASLQALLKLLPLELALVPLYLIVLSMFSAAVFRAVLRPEDKGFARLKFGGDELRLIGLWLLMGLLFFGVALVLGIVIGGGAVAMSLGSKMPSAGVVLGIFVIYLVMIVAMIWVGVKLSLAAPMTFVQRKIRLFGSWRLTKGRFWPLFGCYLLVWIFTILIGLVELVVVGAITLGTSGGSFTQVATSFMRPDYSSYAAYFSVARIITLVIGSAVGAVAGAMALAAPAQAYKEFAGLSPKDQAEAFA